MSNFCYIAHVDAHGKGEGWLVVKIGHSKNPLVRFRDLSAMAWQGPNAMDIADCDGNAQSVELFLHETLKAYRVHGEWFHVPVQKLEDAKFCTENKFRVGFNLRIDGGEWV